MADSMPNYQVEIQRLRSQILDLETNIQKQVLSILEMKDRKTKLLENIVATKKAILDYKEKLQGLEKTHGGLSDADIQKMLDSV
jgi:predicted  nucleic acid-binding Zn-ribbon protein